MVVARLALLTACAWSAAAQVTVKLEAELDPVTAGEAFQLIVSASGGLPESVLFEAVPGLSVGSRPEFQSSNRYSINGRTSHRHILVYLASVSEPGTLTIPAAVVTIDGKEYKTNSLKIKAIERVERPGATLADGIRITSSVDKSEVYEGEAVSLTLSIWELENVSIRGVSSTPTTTGFFAVPQEPVSAGRTQTKQHEGLKYRVQQQKQLLYPTRSGQLQIGGFEWRGNVAGIANVGGMRRRVSENFERTSAPILVTVKPLPERPPGFTGAVGSFLLQGELSTEQVDQGVPVKLALSVTGRGNPRAISIPEIPDLDWAHVDNPVRFDGAPEQAISGRVNQVFEFAITPHEPGKQTIPRIHFVYFDPERETYETESVGPFSLTVFSSGESERPIVFDPNEEPSNASINIISTDILPIVRDTNPLKRGNGLPLLFWIAAVVPVAAYAVAAAYAVHRRRFESDTGYARAYRARSEAHRELRGVLETSNPEEALYRAVIQYIANTFDAPEAGMTAHDADAVLNANGFPEDLRKNVQTILRKCERAVYASQSLPSEDMNALVHGAAAAIDQIEAARKRRKA